MDGYQSLMTSLALICRVQKQALSVTYRSKEEGNETAKETNFQDNLQPHLSIGELLLADNSNRPNHR